ncbi:MAG: T9SS type A sorting domain-containing protein [Wenyingzhuangia sp.]
MHKILFLFLVISFVEVSNAQFLWYEDETDTAQIEFESTISGAYLKNVTNPDITGINTNAIVSKFNREESIKAFLQFDLLNPVTDFTGLSVTIKAYIDLPTESLTPSNSKLRVYFASSSTSGTPYKQLNFTVGQEWQTFTFHFDGTNIPQEVVDTNGYNLIKIGFATGSVLEPAMTYYIDAISGTTEQEVDPTEETAAWLAGSWGVTFPVYGGERLDSEVAGGYDLPSGAQEVVDELSTVGHIITNLSYFAHSHYFTLRENPNVDVALEIHESLVPSVENEAIIFEVMQKFKDAGKKVILYISSNYLDRADDEAHEAWVNYYTNEFAGDEYLAYKDLIEGFIGVVKEYADGYWLDTTSALNDDGHLEDFVEMIRATDPGAAISASPNGAYFTENGAYILVDSDGLDDEDERDYRIVSFEGVNTYQDYTSGHITPLGQGAPPNSWAYEEFTIPAMVTNPWTVFEGNIILKHAWFPVRERWHVSSRPLVFGTEDAYRFAKRIIDANAGVTFATTIDDIGSGKGYMMRDEMDIMKEINNRLLSNPIPDFEPYERPEGAYLVGETLNTSSVNIAIDALVLFPNIVKQRFKLSKEIAGAIVYNLTGQEILEFKNNQVSFDVSILKEGVYLLKTVTKDGEHQVFKFIKQ